MSDKEERDGVRNALMRMHKETGHGAYESIYSQAVDIISELEYCKMAADVAQDEVRRLQAENRRLNNKLLEANSNKRRLYGTSHLME